ncbi:MAG TPA: response regulator [Polyangiaceae bacterium]|nr:response regulator [Polyangiaceae bacterium]
MTARTLRLLLVEDNPEDADLLLHELRQAGFDPQARRVETRAALEQALQSAWDVILCDYSVPALDAPTTLAIIRDRQVNTPCIVVSGRVGEEHAVTSMRHGAQDFISKDKLSRLVPAIERELRDSEVRIKHARVVSTLRAAEASLRAAFELIPDALLIHRDGRIVHANMAAVQLLGANGVEDLIAKSVHSLISSAPQEIFDLHRSETDLPHEPTAAVDLSMVRLDGRSVDVEATATPVLFDGEPAMLAVIRDVSARRELVARTMQVDRMIAIGTLAAGVGHEINNPLAYIMANLGYASDELGRVQRSLAVAAARDPALEPLAATMLEVIAVLEEAEDGARRIRDIARDLKNYARNDQEDHGLVDVREAADSALRMAAAEIRQRARVVREFAEVAPIRAGRSRVGQVLLNLILNAAHAIGEGKPDANEILVRIQPVGDSVAIEIRDTGCGIPPEHIDRLFTPFFTTKPAGKGTGLGLSISRRIVRALGGDIHVQSAPGRGTTMTVVLPAARHTSIPAAAMRTTAERRARILFVDDERIVGVAFQRALSREHDVVVVDDAGEAFDRLRAGQVYDVIFCDLNMPTMTGVDLFDAIERSFPSLARRVVVITGDATDARAGALAETQRAPVLEKPLDMTEVRAHVAKVLADSRSRPMR